MDEAIPAACPIAIAAGMHSIHYRISDLLEQAAAAAEAERKEKEKKQAGEQQLQMLNNEADKMRQLLRGRNNPGRTPARVEKEW